MKKIILIACTFFTVQAYALCPLDSGDSVCSSDLGNPAQPDILKNENMFNFNSEQPPVNRSEVLSPSNQDINIKKQQLQYDSACQFGVCIQDLNNTNNKIQ